MNLRNRLPFLLYASKYQDLIVEGTDKLDLQDALKDWLYYVNAYGKSVQSNVPYDYRELEYIESSGTQYIDTGIIANDSTGFYVDAQKLNTASDAILIGSRENNSNTRCWVDIDHSNNGALVFGWGGSTPGASAPVIGTNRFQAFLNFMNSRNGIVDGQEYPVYATLLQSSLPTQTRNLYLCKANYSGGEFPFVGKVYSVKISQNDTFVRNFVPCKNASGIVGMYDTITQQFFGNAGTGEFIAGPEVVASLPSPYIRTNYVDMQAGSYAITNIIPKSDYSIEIDFKTTTVQPQNTCYFGTRSSTSSGAGISVAHTNTGECIFDVFGQRFSPNITFSNNTRYLYSYNNGTISLSSGGSVLYTNTTTPTDIVTDPFIINALNNIGTAYGNYEGFYLYSFKFRDNTGKLIADYVPAAIDIRAVLYDRVTNQTIMQDTGTWEPGPDTTITYISTPDNPIDIWCNNGALRASINEFDENAVTNGYFYNADLEWVANSSVYTTDYMKTVKGKYTLVLSNTATVTSTVNIRVNLFNANKEIQSQTVIPIIADTTEFTYEVDIPDGISYVRISTNPTFVVVSSFNNSNSVYADGTVETLQLVGKNLFDANSDWDFNTSMSYSAPEMSFPAATSGGTRHTFFFKCKPNTTYTISASTYGDRLWVGGLNNIVDPASYTSENPVSFDTIFARLNSVSEPVTFTTDTDTKLVGVYYSLNTLPTNLQIEEGSTATTYQPYTGDTATCEYLLSLGDYIDVQEVLAGNVTRKLGIKVLDGTEDWTKASDYVRLFLGNALQQQVYTIICSHYPCVASDVSSSTQPANTAKIARSNGMLYITQTAFSTADDWKQWLADQYAAGTPVIIVYPLATETTSTVLEQPLQLENGNNVLQIIEASLDHLELEAKYRKRK